MVFDEIYPILLCTKCYWMFSYAIVTTFAIHLQQYLFFLSHPVAPFQILTKAISPLFHDV